MKAALAVVLLLIFLVSFLLDKTLCGVPAKELRRRARGHKDKKAARLYSLAAFDGSTEMFLWLIGGASAAGLILMAATVKWWIGFIAALCFIWLAWVARPLSRTSGLFWSFASLAASLFLPVVSFLQPVFGRLTPRPKARHSGLYEKEDLMEFLKLQARQIDNRISDDDLKIAAAVLSLSDRTVGEVMTPRRKVKWASGSDAVSPLVADELHKTRHIRFPVVKEIVKSGNPQVIGALYIKDLLDNLEDGGRIREIMHPGAYYINESQNLSSAIDGFLKSGQYLLVVVNNFEEIVGVLTLEAVLSQIFGEKINEEFDQYHDLRSVASYGGQQTRSQPAEAEVE